MIETLFGSASPPPQTENQRGLAALLQLTSSWGEGKGARVGPGSLDPGGRASPSSARGGQGKECVPDV